ncbi:MAG: GGDEF domain-containing protein [Planctomycetota bacterium]|nr:MAG: GGDEF domain-containing protein [Planctomycetota bacterium]REJ89079.1 MAG: GGDEF domain-containing protein [Planctomycetota bacterium]REK25217.1 MAG: GGDEF domain-containing protein [Planctomycetota bacterium]REK32117.1 MAG: GGDEF domain-containing protein [Planctomycetota bacterium]
MQTFSSRLTSGDEVRGARSIVRSGTSLEEVVAQIDLDGPSFVLVVNSDGSPAGVISTEELLQRTYASDDVERLKWAGRPIESILPVSLSGGGHHDESARAVEAAPEARDCTSFVYGGRLHAVATDDDILLSWKSLAPFLSRIARDSLTGLVTRLTFLRSFECELARARRTRKPLTVILADVDDFKQINDQGGHAVGDAVLNSIAAAIHGSVRSYDLAARFAGDEFVALCCECGPEAVHIPVHRIQNAVRRMPVPRELTLRPTLSIGVASIERVDAESTVESMLEQADKALYAAKRAGRNRAFSIASGVGSRPRIVPEEGESACEIERDTAIF